MARKSDLAEKIRLHQLLKALGKACYVHAGALADELAREMDPALAVTLPKPSKQQLLRLKKELRKELKTVVTKNADVGTSARLADPFDGKNQAWKSVSYAKWEIAVA